VETEQKENCKVCLALRGQFYTSFLSEVIRELQMFTFNHGVTGVHFKVIFSI